MAEIFRVSKDVNKAIEEIVRKINEINRKLLVDPDRGITVDSQGAVGTQRVETAINGETILKVKTADGWRTVSDIQALIKSAVEDGTYTVGKGTTTDGTVTITNGIITAIQQATN